SWFIEQMPMRGFQSSMDPRPLIGLGDLESVDSIHVIWPDGAYTSLGETPTSQALALSWKDAGPQPDIVISRVRPAGSAPIFTELDAPSIIRAGHKENPYNDFNRDRLIYHMMSTDGPAMAIADVNGDGREDVFIGGAKDEAASILLQTASGTFVNSTQADLSADARSEDVDAVFFDADHDGDMDLYVASGGNEFSDGSVALRDRLYLNNGSGRMIRTEQILPAGRLENSSCVHPADFDGDGDMDLAVGIRLRPLLYGVPVNGYLLENNGKGQFTDVTKEKAPGLLELGLLTDLKWVDVDNDDDPDLVVIGEWMAPQLFINTDGKLENQTKNAGLSTYKGWWTCLETADLDGDGDLDLVMGNHGLNSRFRATALRPIEMFVNDFDGNGSAEQIMARYVGDTLKTYVRKPDLTTQMPGFRRKYLRFSSYVNESMEDVFGKAALEKSVHWTASDLSSSIAINNGDGTFTVKELPIEAQLSTSYGILIRDFDEDGNEDILIAGNFYAAKPEVGRYDASYGWLLLGDGKGDFLPVAPAASGFRVDGEVRQLKFINIQGKSCVLVGKNNEPVELYSY
ncbi:MAG: FG-GAP-like repeat-containing protein, partial [Bacteroidia bacterium]|nr:FG-GAP-like repeat-containing protein [Bacteroidia bacterium]